MFEYKRYKPADFHEDGTLKLSLLLWLIVLYLSRHVLILMLGALTEFMSSRTGVSASGLSALYSSPLFLLASIPALLVLVARVRRVPSAGAQIRALWRYGATLLVVAAVLDVALLGLHWLQGWLQPNEAQVAGVIIDAYIVTYLLRSKRVRDTFGDFPPPRQSSG